jgi:ribonuclease E
LPRRRSTVREPAPFLVGSTAPESQPAPETVTSEVEPTAPPPPEQPPAPAPEPAAPRRAGWWAKRMLGDKR